MPGDASASARALRSRRQLLDALRTRGYATRAELAEETGLSRSAVANTISQLLAERLVVEEIKPDGSHNVGRTGGPGAGGAIGAGSGRPAGVLALAPADGDVLGIDFGHSHVLVALGDRTGAILAERMQVIDVDSDAQTALGVAEKLVKGVLADAETGTEEIAAVVAGVPGPIETLRGVVLSPTILGSWVDLAPAAELERRIGRPVLIENDANLGAWGEQRSGAARGLKDFLYIKASHGVGAGIVLGGRIYRGTLGIAGEIGHTPIPGATNWCRCGNRGCLETIASSTEVRRQLAHTNSTATGLDLPFSTLGADPVASRIIADAGRTIGRVLADICNFLNPRAIILGGEMGMAGQPFVAGVREAIDRNCLPAVARAVTVAPAALGRHSEVMGAIALGAEASAVAAR